ncbi:MAG: hypothetical protein ACXW5U_27955 [Thermoanaerobaculia bacterium]
MNRARESTRLLVILHPSSFILHPSSFRPSSFILPSRPAGIRCRGGETPSGTLC